MEKYFNFILFGFFFICFIAIDGSLCAQPGPPGGGGGPSCWPPSSCVPIDTGIGFLIAAAVAYGAKKIKDSLPEKKVRE